MRLEQFFFRLLGQGLDVAHLSYGLEKSMLLQAYLEQLQEPLHLISDS